MKAISITMRWALLGAAIFAVSVLGVAVHGQNPLHITHQYSNVDARSLIGLPMGNHKTIVTKDSQLMWSQWSLAQKGRAVNFGFSEQLDGALGIRMSELHGAVTGPLIASAQHLDGMSFPFVITEWKGDSLSVQETAFATVAGNRDLDVVEMIVSNRAADAVTLELRLDGKLRNLPAIASGSQLATRALRLLAARSSPTARPVQPRPDSRGSVPMAFRLWAWAPHGPTPAAQPTREAWESNSLINRITSINTARPFPG